MGFKIKRVTPILRGILISELNFSYKRMALISSTKKLMAMSRSLLSVTIYRVCSFLRGKCARIASRQRRASVNLPEFRFSGPQWALHNRRAFQVPTAVLLYGAPTELSTSTARPCEILGLQSLINFLTSTKIIESCI